MQLKNLKKFNLQLENPKSEIDTNFVIPGSILITHSDSIVDSKWYHAEKSSLIFNKVGFEKYQGEILHLNFRIFYIDFDKKYSLRNRIKVLAPNDMIPIEYDLYSENRASNRIFESNGLKYDGSFNRGFSVGNSQSLVLNSNFNLQLSGDLGNDMTISAAISDDNLPIQPEGNTQLLQEFDKVYMQIDRRDLTIVAGDYEIRRPKGYFIKYNKRLQGLSIQNNQELSDQFELTTAANYAISKGKFARNSFQGEEGNQGPYKLRSNSGGRINKVLAGTEKVYIDGVLLTRGLEQDYIISYDRSELRFTDNFLVTKDKRIVVEFEYADQNYVRSQYGTKATLRSEKMNIRLNMYNEQDNKNTTGDIDLDSLDLVILNESGDNIDQIFKNGILAVTGTNDGNQALYTKKFESSISDSILVYEPDPAIAQYLANFTELGLGYGSYEIDIENSINGRAYQWVGAGHGSFEPIIKIIPPERRFMFSLGSDYYLSKNTQFNLEFALSNFDINRFSNNGNDDNSGVGLFGTINHTFILDSEQDLPKKITFQASSEWINKDFQSLNPYRKIEFFRDWNTNQNFTDREIINTLGIGYVDDQKIQLRYSLSNYSVANQYKGIKHSLDYKLSIDQLYIYGKSSILNSEDHFITTKFLRPFLSIEKGFGKGSKIKIGASFDGENNQIKLLNIDELNPLSQRFDDVQVFLNYSPTESASYQIKLKSRDDYAPSGKQLELSTQAMEMELLTKSKIGNHSSLDANFTIRDLKIANIDLTQEQAQRSYLGRLDYGLKLFNSGIRSNTSYQISSGMEPKLEYEYIEVQNGEGNYIWLDDGDDIQQINEFQIAPVQDTANFLRITIVNNEFIRTDGNSLNQNTRIDFRNILGSENRSLLKKFSLLSNVRIKHKAMDEAGSRSPLFKFNSLDTALVSYLASQNHTLFFNKGNPSYDVQTGVRINQNKLVQITGFESFRRLENFLRFRWNYHRGLDLIFNISNGNNNADSEFFDANDFNFDIFKIEPQMIYRPTNKLRLKLNYRYDQRVNDPNIIVAKAQSNHLGLEVNIRRSNQLNINTNLSFIKVLYEGPTNGVLQLTMLEGLQNGNNFLWGFDVIKRLSNKLNLIFNYEGRKTGDVRSIHTARAQAKLNF